MCSTIPSPGRVRWWIAIATPCITSASSWRRSTAGAHPNRAAIRSANRSGSGERPIAGQSRVADVGARPARSAGHGSPGRSGSPCRPPTPPGGRRRGPLGARARLQPVDVEIVQAERVARRRAVLHSPCTQSFGSRPSDRSRSCIQTGTSISPPDRSVATCSPSSAHTWQLPMLSRHAASRWSSSGGWNGGVHAVAASRRRPHRPEALHRHRRHRLDQRRGVGAARGSAEQLAHPVGEPAGDRQPDQLAVVVLDPRARSCAGGSRGRPRPG